MTSITAAEPNITLRPVDSDNWRSVSALSVSKEQREFVAEPNLYLALCCYDTWNPLAIYLNDAVIGFMMWGIDDDKSCWLGGIFVDQAQQRKGYGRKAVQVAIATLAKQTGASEFALSYLPTNTAAKHLYSSMGFVETGELEDDELVARLQVAPPNSAT